MVRMQRSGGYLELAGRFQLRWKPASDLETLVNIHGRELDGSTRLFRANIIAPDRGGLTEGFSRDRIAIDGRNTRELNAHGMTVEVRYRTGTHELVSLTGMERRTDTPGNTRRPRHGPRFWHPPCTWAIPWKSAGGLRFSRDAKDYTARRVEAPSVSGAGGIGPIHRSPTDSAWSGDLSMRYTVSSGVQTYIRAARGFRAPSIQGRLLFGDMVSVAGTETIYSIEGGTKMRLWDGRLRFNLAAFHYRLHNQQLTAVGDEANFNRLVNTDRTLGRGFEAEVTLAPTGRLRLTTGLSYYHTRIEDDDLAVQGCGAPCTVLDLPGPEPGTVRLDGNGLPQAPRWIADAILRYPVILPDGSYLAATAYLAYRSAVRFFLYESVEFQDDRLLECGVRLSYLARESGLEISLVGRNIFDDVSFTGGIDFNNLTGFVIEPPYWAWN